jgi:prepilin-type N-terminal cleavage/methylation domain-containing protein
MQKNRSVVILNIDKKIRANEYGFSFIEVIAVLILMGILASMAAASLGNSNVEVVGQAEMIKATLRFAQARSMNTDANFWGVQLDSTTNTYWLFFCPTDNTACNVGSAAFRSNIPGAQLDAQNRMTLMNSVSLSSKTTIVFDNFGTPYSWNGSVPTLTLLSPLSTNASAARIANSQNVTIQDNSGNAVTIRINAETGYIS